MIEFCCCCSLLLLVFAGVVLLVFVCCSLLLQVVVVRCCIGSLLLGVLCRQHIKLDVSAYCSVLFTDVCCCRVLLVGCQLLLFVGVLFVACCCYSVLRVLIVLLFVFGSCLLSCVYYVSFYGCCGVVFSFVVRCCWLMRVVWCLFFVCRCGLLLL